MPLMHIDEILDKFDEDATSIEIIECVVELADKDDLILYLSGLDDGAIERVEKRKKMMQEIYEMEHKSGS